MKLSIEQKQEIYEHLLTLNCPDLLAALIAERCTESAYRRIFVEGDLDDFTATVYAAFYWDESPEGHEFWYFIAEDKLLAESEAKDSLPCDEIQLDTSQPEIIIPPVCYSVGDVVYKEGKKFICIGSDVFTAQESQSFIYTSFKDSSVNCFIVYNRATELTKGEYSERTN